MSILGANPAVGVARSPNFGWGTWDRRGSWTGSKYYHSLFCTENRPTRYFAQKVCWKVVCFHRKEKTCYTVALNCNFGEKRQFLQLITKRVIGIFVWKIGNFS